MKVFTDYSEQSAHLLRVWVRSWAARGWEPRLIFQNSVDRKNKLVVSPYVINFGYRARSKKLTLGHYGAKGWEDSGLVAFPEDSTEDTVLNCGRSLCSNPAPRKT